MIVQFFRYGNGMSKGPLDYLLGKDRKRDHAKILSGDEQEIIGLIDSSPFAKKYTTGCLSFYENDLSEKAKQKIMTDFEKCLFPGMGQDQYRVLWIAHQDKKNDETGEKRLELNFLIPNTEITTGQRLQPFFHKQDLSRVDLFKNIVNFEHGLHDPNDPLFKRAITNKKSLPKDIAKMKTAIDTEAQKAIENGLVNDRQSLKKWLTDLGLEITREVKKSISIKNPDDEKSRPIRLTGAIYEQDFRITASSAELTREASEQYRKGARQRNRENIQRYTDYFAKKSIELDRKYRQCETEHTNTSEQSDSANSSANNDRYTADHRPASTSLPADRETTSATAAATRTKLEQVQPIEPTNSRISEPEKSPFYIEFSTDFSSLYSSYQRHLANLRQQEQVERDRSEKRKIAADRSTNRSENSGIYPDHEKLVSSEERTIENDTGSAIIANYRAATAAAAATTRAVEAATAKFRYDSQQSYAELNHTVQRNRERTARITADAKIISDNTDAISTATEQHSRIYAAVEQQVWRSEPTDNKQRGDTFQNLFSTARRIQSSYECSTKFAANIGDIERNLITVKEQISKQKNEIDKPEPKQDRGIDLGM